MEADVSLSFAWSWRTDVKNWDDPPAHFHLDGRFASGAWGTRGVVSATIDCIYNHEFTRDCFRGTLIFNTEPI